MTKNDLSRSAVVSHGNYTGNEERKYSRKLRDNSDKQGKPYNLTSGKKYCKKNFALGHFTDGVKAAKLAVISQRSVS